MGLDSLNLREITYAFKCCVIAIVKDNKRDKVHSGVRIEVTAKHIKEAIDAANKAVGRNKKILEVVSVEFKSVAFAFYGEDKGYADIPSELIALIPLPESWKNSHKERLIALSAKDPS